MEKFLFRLMCLGVMLTGPVLVPLCVLWDQRWETLDAIKSVYVDGPRAFWRGEKV